MEQMGPTDLPRAGCSLPFLCLICLYRLTDAMEIGCQDMEFFCKIPKAGEKHKTFCLCNGYVDCVSKGMWDEKRQKKPLYGNCNMCTRWGCGGGGWA